VGQAARQMRMNMRREDKHISTQILVATAAHLGRMASGPARPGWARRGGPLRSTRRRDPLEIRLHLQSESPQIPIRNSKTNGIIEPGCRVLVSSMERRRDADTHDAECACVHQA
jgi:hypothetical protein